MAPPPLSCGDKRFAAPIHAGGVVSGRRLGVRSMRVRHSSASERLGLALAADRIAGTQARQPLSQHCNAGAGAPWQESCDMAWSTSTPESPARTENSSICSKRMPLSFEDLGIPDRKAKKLPPRVAAKFAERVRAHLARTHDFQHAEDGGSTASSTGDGSPRKQGSSDGVSGCASGEDEAAAATLASELDEDPATLESSDASIQAPQQPQQVAVGQNEVAQLDPVAEWLAEPAPRYLELLAMPRSLAPPRRSWRSEAEGPPVEQSGPTRAFLSMMRRPSSAPSTGPRGSSGGRPQQSAGNGSGHCAAGSGQASRPRSAAAVRSRWPEHAGAGVGMRPRSALVARSRGRGDGHTLRLRSGVRTTNAARVQRRRPRGTRGRARRRLRQNRCMLLRHVGQPLHRAVLVWLRSEKSRRTCATSRHWPLDLRLLEQRLKIAGVP
eukprot:TRINITY_DN28530_c0_g1_i2.p1 TRINITY_DN28530_c0_g1~~TRINITY_DN28530_c0_g1_i2.p1  ORF type:complete len:460 (+),score=54.58 TRINITY_DN28530_c0_g1_i2:65-1381(+)